MPNTTEDIRGLLDRHEVALRSHHRATGGAVDDLNADIDALTALLGDDELETVGRYLEQLLEIDDEARSPDVLKEEARRRRSGEDGPR